MEGSRPAFPLDGERPGARVGAPVEEVKGRSYWKLPWDLPTCLTALYLQVGTWVGDSP